MKRFKRVRFRANEEDPRPIFFPPPGPYWITGYGNGYAMVVAYVRSVDEVGVYWPEARPAFIEILEENVVPEFTDRFRKPEWWNDKQ